MDEEYIIKQKMMKHSTKTAGVSREPGIATKAHGPLSLNPPQLKYRQKIQLAFQGATISP
ncbi:MAG: hypothetical protein CMM07_23610 [Rhodopirellula sp.]|nr:hypothetical protein [Rhodopirellula sp.]